MKNNNYTNNYTQNLKFAIIRSGYKQFQIAEKLNITNTCFSLKLHRRCVNGKNRIFSVNEIIKLTEILNISLDYIFRKEDIA